MPEAFRHTSARDGHRTAASAGRRYRAIRRGSAVVVAAVAGGGLVALPAHAATGTGVNVTSTQTTPQRTLQITDLSGNQLTPASTLDATNGPADFNVSVTDSSQQNQGFQVTATMSNLYGYDAGQWNCAASIDSKYVSLATTAGSTIESGVSAVLAPTFGVAGTIDPTLATTITTALASLNLGTLNTTPTGTLTGELPTSFNSQLTSTQLLGTAGPVSSGTLTGEPIQLTPGSSTASPFSSPDVPPSLSGCAAPGGTATPVTVMQGGANPTGLATVLGTLSGATSATAVPNLITSGYLTQNQIVAWLTSPGVLFSSGVNATTFETLLGATNLQTLLGEITGGVTGVAPLGQNTGILQNGTYSDAPQLTVSTGGASAGTYRGELTLTLMST